MVAAVVERMKATGAKTVGYIGYNDAWGDLVYDALKKTAEPAGMQIVTNERYARADTSVTAQALRIVAAAPEVVMTGGSGTPGALPFIALTERGYKGQIYGTHALINPDFVRVGGAAVEGVMFPTGPVVVASQLPQSNPIRKVALDTRPRIRRPTTSRARRVRPLRVRWLAHHARCGGARARNRRATGHAAIREAMRDAIVTTKDWSARMHLDFRARPATGVDDRARVLVKLVDGKWKPPSDRCSLQCAAHPCPLARRAFLLMHAAQRQPPLSRKNFRYSAP